MPVLSVKVRADVAAGFRAVSERLDESVSDTLREYVEAVAAGSRWQIVDDEDNLLGYAFLLPRCPACSGVADD
jgi:hypothetical protein